MKIILPNPWTRKGAYYYANRKVLLKYLGVDEYHLGLNEKHILKDHGNIIIRRFGKKKKIKESINQDTITYLKKIGLAKRFNIMKQEMIDDNIESVDEEIDMREIRKDNFEISDRNKKLCEKEGIKMISSKGVNPDVKTSLFPEEIILNGGIE